MAVKITANGIDTIQDNIISGSKIADNSIGPIDLPSNFPVQIVKTYTTARGAYTIGTSDTIVPNMSVTITPKLSGSNFLIMVRLMTETSNAQDVVYNIQKNGARINVAGSTWFNRGLSMTKQTYNGADNTDSTPEMLMFRTWDTTGSTAGTAITFRLVSSTSSDRTSYYGSDWGANNGGGNEISSSEIIVMEFKG